MPRKKQKRLEEETFQIVIRVSKLIDVLQFQKHLKDNIYSNLQYDITKSEEPFRKAAVSINRKVIREDTIVKRLSQRHD